MREHKQVRRGYQLCVASQDSPVTSPQTRRPAGRSRLPFEKRVQLIPGTQIISSSPLPSTQLPFSYLFIKIQSSDINIMTERSLDGEVMVKITG